MDRKHVVLVAAGGLSTAVLVAALWRQKRQRDEESDTESGPQPQMSRCKSVLIRPPTPTTSGAFNKRMSIVAEPEAKTHSGSGILVHGCHLAADDWEGIVWGHGGKMGRLPTAVCLAAEQRASLMAFGTGASVAADGRLEGRYTLDVLHERMSRLHEFEALQRFPLQELEALVRRISVAETESQNTTSEIRAALDLFRQHGCTRVFLVSSPTHLPRCLACACEASRNFQGAVYATPSETCYADYQAADVVVVEPPHRGDRDKELDSLPFHAMVKRSFKVGAEARADFLREFDALLTRFGAPP